MARQHLLQPPNRATAAASAVTALAERIGVWPDDLSIPPRVIRQTWSPLHCPLIWGAAGGQDSHPIIEGLEAVTKGYPSLALRPHESWHRLRAQIRSWGVNSENELAECMGREGHGRIQPNQYIQQGVQEHIVDRATLADLEIAYLEASYVAATHCLASNRGLLAALSANLTMRTRAQRSNPATNHAVPTISHQQPTAPRPHDPASANAEIAQAGAVESREPCAASRETSSQRTSGW